METEKKIELDSPIKVGLRVLTPVSTTFVAWHASNAAGRGFVIREAIAVIVAAAEGVTVLMCDGRQLSLEQLAKEHPVLSGSLAQFNSASE